MDIQKVYIVTAGTYSDYHIEKVFTNKLKAELYSATLDSFVEEFDISDEEIEGKVIYVYRLLLEFNPEGKAEEEKFKIILDKTPKKCLDKTFEDIGRQVRVNSGVIREVSDIVLSEENLDRANKTAQDRLAEFKAKIEQIF